MIDYIENAIAELNAQIDAKAAAAAEDAATHKKESDDALIEALIAGREITRDMAMTIPKVSACANRISDAIASIPFRLYRRSIEGDRIKTEEVTDDPRVALINVDTKDTLTGFEFKKALIIDYLLGGAGYAYINRSGNTIESLNYVDDRIVAPMLGIDPIFKSYALMINGKMFEDYEVFRVLRSTKDGSRGKSLIKEISKAIETAYSALCYELHVTNTGGAKKGFLQAPGSPSEQVKKEIKAAWNRLYSSEASENIVLLSNGITFQEANQTPLDLQLDKIRADMNRDIQEAFGLEDDDQKFLNHTIRPILTAMENAMNVFLLLAKEQSASYFKADTRQIENIAGSAMLSINEARYRENLPTIPGLNIIPLSLGTTFIDADTGNIIVPNTGQTLSPEGGKNAGGSSPGTEGGDE